MMRHETLHHSTSPQLVRFFAVSHHEFLLLTTIGIPSKGCRRVGCVGGSTGSHWGTCLQRCLDQTGDHGQLADGHDVSAFSCDGAVGPCCASSGGQQKLIITLGGKSSCDWDCHVFWIDILPLLGNWSKSHHGTYNAPWRYIDDWWVDCGRIHGEQLFFLHGCPDTTLIIQGQNRHDEKEETMHVPCAFQTRSMAASMIGKSLRISDIRGYSLQHLSPL